MSSEIVEMPHVFSFTDVADYSCMRLFLRDMLVLPHDCVPCFGCPLWFVCCGSEQYLVQRRLNFLSSCELSTEIVLSSYLSELSTLTSMVSPSLDHACMHKRRSDMKCQNSPLSLLPSQTNGFGLDLLSATPFNMSNLPLTVSFSSFRTYRVTVCHVMSHLLLSIDHVCCGDDAFAEVAAAAES